MAAFYEAWLGRGQSKPAAVHAAQEAVRTWTNAAGRRPYADPVYWAGFAIIGE